MEKEKGMSELEELRAMGIEISSSENSDSSDSSSSTSSGKETKIMFRRGVKFRERKTIIGVIHFIWKC